MKIIVARAKSSAKAASQRFQRSLTRACRPKLSEFLSTLREAALYYSRTLACRALLQRNQFLCGSNARSQEHEGGMWNVGHAWRAKRRRANRQNPMGQSEYPEAESVSRPSDRFVEEDGDEEAESLILHCIFNSFFTAVPNGPFLGSLVSVNVRRHYERIANKAGLFGLLVSFDMKRSKN